jgi:hypothetical protein
MTASASAGLLTVVTPETSHRETLPRQHALPPTWLTKHHATVRTGKECMQECELSVFLVMVITCNLAQASDQSFSSTRSFFM